jgi:hypothetical protein
MEKYSKEKLTDADLDRLLEIERAERERLLHTGAVWGAHRDRLLCICLAQGAALHLLDGRNGIKDLDVWTFFSRSPDLESRVIDSGFRKGRHRDSGLTHLGRWVDPEGPARYRGFSGRRVDLFGAAIPFESDADPVAMLRTWLGARRTTRARYLAEKAVVMLWPERLKVVWPVEADGQSLRGYAPSR